MALLSVLVPDSTLYLSKPIPTSLSKRPLKFTSDISVPYSVLPKGSNSISISQWVRTSTLRARRFQHEDAENNESTKNASDDQDKALAEVIRNKRNEPNALGGSFLITVAIPLAIATVLTILSIGLKQPSSGFFGVQFQTESSLRSTIPMGFSFKAFGYRIMLPEYAPGWIYFWLLMAAGCGLFISEEALNIWVGISLSRMLSLGGTWQSFIQSFSRNAPYIVSTVLWVYWGVCISDMIPFYLGKLFRQSGASDDVCSKLGIGEEKVLRITRLVQKYGNLAGVVERFSLGVRNPTGFLAGMLGISPEGFLAGVCCGCLITLPLQLGIGFLLRERPVFALATVATVVGVWTVFPYAVAALTAFYFYLRSRYTT